MHRWTDSFSPVSLLFIWKNDVTNCKVQSFEHTWIVWMSLFPSTSALKPERWKKTFSSLYNHFLCCNFNLSSSFPSPRLECNFPCIRFYCRQFRVNLHVCTNIQANSNYFYFPFWKSCKFCNVVEKFVVEPDGIELCSIIKWECNINHIAWVRSEKYECATNKAQETITSLGTEGEKPSWNRKIFFGQSHCESDSSSLTENCVLCVWCRFSSAKSLDWNWFIHLVRNVSSYI